MSNHFIKKKTLQTGMFKEVVKKVMQSGTDWTAIKKRILELLCGHAIWLRVSLALVAVPLQHNGVVCRDSEEC